MVLAYHHYKYLPSRNINLERLVGIRERAYVPNPVGADVGRVEAPQIRRSKDVVVPAAGRIRIDVHALSGIGAVGEHVNIVTELTRITKDRARLTSRTGLRHTARNEFISLRRIPSANASVNHDRRARRAPRRRRRRRSPARATAIDVKNDVVVWKTNVANRRRINYPASHRADIT